MSRRLPLLVWGFCLLLATTAAAQNRVLNELYGNGVHAFNSYDYEAALSLLSEAIDNGSKDPRAYYYRGLSQLRMGRQTDAESDFQLGAELEVADVDRFYNVSKSLERIQGRQRAMLERFRSEARLMAYQSLERRRIDRYERIRDAESEVLLPDSSGDGAPLPPAVPADDDDADGNLGGEPAEAEDDADPFGETDSDAADDEMPAEDDAAEDDAADDEPAEEMPAEDDAVDPDDPFAEDDSDEDAAGDDAAEDDADDDASDDDASDDDASDEDASEDDESADETEDSEAGSDDPFGN